MPLSGGRQRRLLGGDDLALDVDEFVVDRGAERASAGNDGDGDEGGDQAVFDGGGATLVADEGGD